MRVPSTSGSPEDPQLLSEVLRLTSNGTIVHLPPPGFDGFDQVTTIVNVPTPTPNLQPGSANITTNDTTTYYPSSGYDGFSSFTVTTNVQPTQEDLDIVSISVYISYDISTTPREVVNLSDFQYYPDGAQVMLESGTVYVAIYPPGGQYTGFTHAVLSVINGGSDLWYYRNLLYLAVLQGRYTFDLNVVVDRQDNDPHVFIRAYTGGSNTELYLDREDLPSTWWT